MESKRDEVRIRLLKHLGTGGVGAEVGVWKGDFSEQILEVVQPETLHLIDPWLYQPEFSNVAFGRDKYEDEMEQFYKNVTARYINDPRVKIHRMTSDEAFELFEDSSLDWVYLDGNHNAPYIDRDLENALKKVKPNGQISGDDYYWDSGQTGQPVKTAVEKILDELGDKASLKTIGGQFLIRLNREG